MTKSSASKLSIVLLHHPMHDKEGKIVATSLTAIDVHDISRSAATFGASPVYIAHPSVVTRRLAETMHSFWSDGYGAVYNPNRKEALDHVRIVSDLDAVIHDIALIDGCEPQLIATSAKPGNGRISFETFKEMLAAENGPAENGQERSGRYLLMFGTGWGMTDELLARAQFFLEPINGPTEYNHLSVRSACAIMLDRIFGR